MKVVKECKFSTIAVIAFQRSPSLPLPQRESVQLSRRRAGRSASGREIIQPAILGPREHFDRADLRHGRLGGLAGHNNPGDRMSA